MRLARRGRANKVRGESQLGPGDLVLAKYKGFPGWPAKISRPEDWKLSPNPEKFFVQFFGTQEMGFVAPADIQKFTYEVTSKLSAQCQRKIVKCFPQAVEEICLAFDEVDKKAFDQVVLEQLEQLRHEEKIGYYLTIMQKTNKSRHHQPIAEDDSILAVSTREQE